MEQMMQGSKLFFYLTVCVLTASTLQSCYIYQKLANQDRVLERLSHRQDLIVNYQCYRTVEALNAKHEFRELISQRRSFVTTNIGEATFEELGSMVDRLWHRVDDHELTFQHIIPIIRDYEERGLKTPETAEEHKNSAFIPVGKFGMRTYYVPVTNEAVTRLLNVWRKQ